MLSFAVPKLPVVLTPLRHASLLGPEDMQASGTIDHEPAASEAPANGAESPAPPDAEAETEAGYIRCETTDTDTAALALQVQLAPKVLADIGLDPDRVPSPGVITLQTCLLPNSEAPYRLCLELARHRAMLFLNKLEDWQLADLPLADPIMQRFEEARQAFTQALVTRSTDPDGSDRMALRSLCLAIDATDRLARREAARAFVPRVTGQTYLRVREQTGVGPIVKGKPLLPVSSPERHGVALPGRPAMGCAITPMSFNERFQTVAASICDFVAMPMRWIELEPEEGFYNYAPTDRWIEWAVRKAKLPVVAGPLIDFRATAVPDWIFIWQNDYETLRDLVEEHATNVIRRYRRTISRWTVASGLHTNTNFRLSFDQIMDLTKLCVKLVREHHPTGRIQLEVTQPWGEYYSANRRALPPALYAEMVAQAGIMVDSIAVRLQLGQSEPGQSSRDLMAIASLLDRYAELDKPLALVVGVPSAMPESASDPKLADKHPGYWHRPWSDELQADWVTEAVSFMLSRPYVQSVCWQDLYDQPQHAEMPRGGLVAVNGNAKPAVTRLGELRAAVQNAAVPDRLAELVR